MHTFCESDKVKPYVNIGLRVLDVDVTGPAAEDDDTDADSTYFQVGVVFAF